mmetsp:Transcript_31448/g.66598  ORF Transcript_31448/g.66598 Transcript_31448/m.66598 type:complete len:111 (-) Transcript_31448:448-780(-)
MPHPHRTIISYGTTLRRDRTVGNDFFSHDILVHMASFDYNALMKEYIWLCVAYCTMEEEEDEGRSMDSKCWDGGRFERPSWRRLLEDGGHVEGRLFWSLFPSLKIVCHVS